MVVVVVCMVKSKKLVGKEKKINRWLDTRLISKYKYETRGAQKKNKNLKLINNLDLTKKKLNQAVKIIKAKLNYLI